MGSPKIWMEIPRDVGAIYNPSLRLRDASPPPTPLARFLADYRELISAPVTFALPSGHQVWHPTPKWVDERCNILSQLFDRGELAEKAYERKVHGGFSEIVAPIVLDTMIRQMTGGEFICIPALPQLDMEGPHLVQSPDDPNMWVIDKSADVVIGRVTREAGRVTGVEPVMFFDIKAGARGDKGTTRVGVGYNERLGPAFPVGIFYAGDLRFEDREGHQYSAKDYFINVVEPRVREGEIPWQVAWPTERGMLRHALFDGVREELERSCCYTARSIKGKGHMPESLRRELLTNIAYMQRILGLSDEITPAPRGPRRDGPAWRN